MADPQSTIQKAAAARERGELWRAKEILQGRLSLGEYQPEVHGELGRVLLEMKDTLEAGRHLYACFGVRGGSSEGEAAVALFLSRHGRGSAQHLRTSLPARARKAPFESLPVAVREDLLERGFEPSELMGMSAQTPSASSGHVGLILFFVVLAIAVLLFLVILGLGVDQAIQIVSEWLD